MEMKVEKPNLDGSLTPDSLTQLYDAVLADPETRYRLRTRIIEDHKQDPVDALQNAVILFNLAASRVVELSEPYALADFESLLARAGTLETRIDEDSQEDPVDAMYDAQVLLGLANARYFQLRTILRPISADVLRERGSTKLN
jgi:hypothetical protein